MSPLQRLLLELEGELCLARDSAVWIGEHHRSADVQFLVHHIKSALFEVGYLQSQEIPA